MLMREDKKRIPLAFLPNGSGDDFCSSLGILSMDHALDYICKGETIKVDTVRVLLDHESEETLPEGPERYNVCRHMLTNSGLAMTPLVSIKAQFWKGCCGKASYTIAAILEAIKGNLVSDHFEILVDGERVENKEQHSSICIMAFNGKFTGGGMMLDPYGCVNDGMLDIIWTSDPAVNNLMGVSGLMDKAKAGGIHVYDHQSKCFRGKQIIARFKGKDIRNPPATYGNQLFGCDGEDMTFKTHVQWDAIKNNLEVCFDSESYFAEYEWFLSDKNETD
jgi:diacylglycerol kinase family enzyme